MSRNRDFSAREKLEQLEKQILSLPLNFCDPIIIGRHPDVVGQTDAVVFTASGTYLELNGRKLLVTNAHVARKYEEEREKDARSIIMVAEHEFVDFMREEIGDKWGEIDRFSPDRDFSTPAGFVAAMRNLGFKRITL